MKQEICALSGVFVLGVFAMMASAAAGGSIGGLEVSSGDGAGVFTAGDSIGLQFSVNSDGSGLSKYQVFAIGYGPAGGYATFVVRPRWPLTGWALALEPDSGRPGSISGVIRSDVMPGDYDVKVYLYAEGAKDYEHIVSVPLTIENPTSWEDIRFTSLSPNPPDAFAVSGCTDCYYDVTIQNMNPSDSFTGSARVTAGSCYWDGGGAVEGLDIAPGDAVVRRLRYVIPDPLDPEALTISCTIRGYTSSGDVLHPAWPRFTLSGEPLPIVRDFEVNDVAFTPGETVVISAEIGNLGDEAIPAGTVVNFQVDHPGLSKDSGSSVTLGEITPGASSQDAQYSFTVPAGFPAEFFTNFRIILRMRYPDGTTMSFRRPADVRTYTQISRFIGSDDIIGYGCASDPSGQYCIGSYFGRIIAPQGFVIGYTNVVKGENVLIELTRDRSRGLITASGMFEVDVSYVSEVPSFDLGLFSLLLLFGAALYLSYRGLGEELEPGEEQCQQE